MKHTTRQQGIDLKLMIELHHNDALVYLKGQKDNFVNHTFTSPPYNIGGTRTGHKAQAKYEHFYDKKRDYFEWCTEIIDQLLRVTEGYVFWNIQAGSKNKHHVYKLMGHYSKNIQQNFIWYKKNATPSSTKYAVSNVVEYILVLTDGRKVKSNVHFITNHVDIIKKKNKQHIHNAQMPIELANYFIKNFTKEEEVILDPFMGVGTTGLSCRKYNRSFVGVELVGDYYDIARKRLNGGDNESR